LSNNYFYSVNNKKWSIKTIEERKVNKLIQDLAISDFLARIICSRNIEISQAENFIYPSLKKQLPSPLLLKDMNIAVIKVRAIAF
jgi:single-stranded-DNA-specific exonuclease